MRETNWQRLHRVALARLDHLGVTQDAMQEVLGGPSRGWLHSIKSFEGPPTPRNARSLTRLDAALGWPVGTAHEFVSRDTSGDSPDLLADEERGLIDYKDKVDVFLRLVARRLRALPEEDLRPAMLDISRRIGIPVLEE